MNQTLERLFKYNNPWESSKKKRGAWADELEIPTSPKEGVEADLCYFVGCTTSFDDTAQRIARSFSEILGAAGVNFGILGRKSPAAGILPAAWGNWGCLRSRRRVVRNSLKNTTSRSL
jgi:Fe-S oxidoreductase